MHGGSCLKSQQLRQKGHKFQDSLSKYSVANLKKKKKELGRASTSQILTSSENKI